MDKSSEFTIADVASRAGVSISTVSRILNGKQDVAAATRQRVQQVIDELGYTPHAQARGLRAGKTHSIAMIFPQKHPSSTPFNPLDMDFMLGGAVAAGERSFLFNLFTSQLNRRSLLEMYRSAQVDGTMLMQIYINDWRVDLLREKGLPFVMIGRTADTTGINSIDIDFAGASHLAFEHLVSAGHRKIALLGHAHNLHDAGYGPALRSWQGYEAATQAYAIESIFRETGFSGSEIYQQTLDLLDEHPDLTAIVTTHAHAALHIIQALDARGKHIPQHFSVIAVTAARIAELSSPRLTYIDFPSYEMGYRAASMLIRMLTGEAAAPEQIVIPPRLVIGNSTGPVK